MGYIIRNTLIAIQLTLKWIAIFRTFLKRFIISLFFCFANNFNLLYFFCSKISIICNAALVGDSTPSQTACSILGKISKILGFR